MSAGGKVFKLGDVELQSGEVLAAARLVYQTYGDYRPGMPVILLPTFYTGTHIRNEAYLRALPSLDPGRRFIISINMFGNGLSSSPSNTAAPQDGPRFPPTTLYDNVRCQQRLLQEVFGVETIDLVFGWSMAACQAFEWAAQFPDRVRAILPFCGSAKASYHNIVFLEGVKAALQADQTFNGGDYRAPPAAGLKAFGRVYAGWAFSQTFYRERLHRALGFETYEALLADWERDHLQWDANDLLAMLWTWQHADISANATYNGDYHAALGAISAHAIVVPCSTDLYFPPQDSAIEVEHMPNAQMRCYESPWGHCVAAPGRDLAFMRFLDSCVVQFLDRS
ncbi:MAG: alpha/beta fold hydrolase [Gammaproteobacteria bacterium]|nr:alpha/beta fold hydrolase [Gammaproteobacteria bacterium]